MSIQRPTFFPAILADCWQIALLTITPFLFQEVFQSVLIYKDNFASSVELLTFAIIDVISKVLSKYLIERKTTEVGGGELNWWWLQNKVEELIFS